MDVVDAKISSLGLMDSEWQEREQNLLRQLEDERFRYNCFTALSYLVSALKRAWTPNFDTRFP